MVGLYTKTKRTRISEETVASIRAARKAGLTLKVIATRYNVNKDYVSTCCSDIHITKRPERLNPREIEAIYLMSHGYGDKDLAIIQGVKVNTVKTRNYTIFRKMGVLSRAHAVAICIRKGIIP